jgi:hypothetical protein
MKRERTVVPVPHGRALSLFPDERHLELLTE